MRKKREEEEARAKRK